jgi:hypothetical protein
VGGLGFSGGGGGLGRREEGRGKREEGRGEEGREAYTYTHPLYHPQEPLIPFSYPLINRKPTTPSHPLLTRSYATTSARSAVLWVWCLRCGNEISWGRKAGGS